MTLTRLQPGMIVRWNGAEHRVAFVNDCRAHIIPLAKVTVQIKPRFGPPCTFQRTQPGMDISPNSEIEIL